MPKALTQPSPRTAVVWGVLQREFAARGAKGAISADSSVHAETGIALRIVDAGGGTGGFAVPLAKMGHYVTVVDPSPDALAGLHRRAADQGVKERIESVQADADQLLTAVGANSADLVLCHSVFEIVDDPVATAQAVTQVLRPAGAVSVLVANQVGAVLTRAVAGDFTAAMQILNGQVLTSAANPSSKAQPRRFDCLQAQQLLTQAGLAVEQIHGAGVFVDLITSAGTASSSESRMVPTDVWTTDPWAISELQSLELALAAKPPYRDIAVQLHLLARRVEH